MVSFSDILRKGDNNKITEDCIKLINVISDEDNSIKRKENNIIIFGVEESKKENESETKDDDELTVKNLIGKIDKKAPYTNTHRIGKKWTGKTRPIAISLKEKSQVVPLLKKFNEVKDKELDKNIYLNKDLTDAERVKNKELRDLKKKKNSELLLRQPNSTYRYCIRGTEVLIINLKDKYEQFKALNKSYNGNDSSTMNQDQNQ